MTEGQKFKGAKRLYTLEFLSVSGPEGVMLVKEKTKLSMAATAELLPSAAKPPEPAKRENDILNAFA